MRMCCISVSLRSFRVANCAASLLLLACGHAAAQNVFFGNIGFVGGTTGRIYTCDLDGAGLNNILPNPGGGVPVGVLRRQAVEPQVGRLDDVVVDRDDPRDLHARSLVRVSRTRSSFGRCFRNL